MNKKYLSVILFGALMLGSTGTFTSCKDYDDDITNLQDQIDKLATKEDMEAKLSQMQTSIDAAKTAADAALAKAEEALKKAEEAGDQEAIENMSKEVEDLKDRVKALEDAAIDVEALKNDIKTATDEQLADFRKTIEKMLSDMETKLGLTVGDMVTSVELVYSFTSPSQDDEPELKFTTATVANANVFEEGISNAIEFAKGEQRQTESSFIVRVSPADAELTPNMISLVNSRGENLDDMLTITKVERYKDLLTRAAGNSGLWEVTVKLTSYNKDAFEKATLTGENKDKKILFAAQVNNTPGEENASRYVTSSYDLTLTWAPYEPVATLNYFVNEKNISEVNNRYSFGNNKSLPDYKGTATPVKEYTWLNKTAIEGIYTGNGVNAKVDDSDDRHEKMAYPAVQGNEIVISLTSSNDKIVAPENIRAMYVTLDYEANAVESAPSEWNAWNSYNYEGLNTVVEGTKATIKIDSDKAINDFIGFRVYAVNHDGTLVDPDGKAFYVKVGDVAVDWNAVSTVIIPDADKSTYNEVSSKEAVTLTKLTGASAAKWVTDKIDNNEAVFNVVFEDKDGQVLYTASSANDSPANVDFSKVTKVYTVPTIKDWAKYVDNKAYNGTLTISNADGFVLATINVSMTKQLPGKPEGFSIKTNQLDENGVYNCYLIPNNWTADMATQGTMTMSHVFNWGEKNEAGQYEIYFAEAAYDTQDKVTNNVAYGDGELTVKAAFIDNTKQHATTVYYNYGKISSEAKKDNKIVEYMVEVETFPTVFNCIYNTTYKWHWGTIEEIAKAYGNEWAKKNTDGSYKYKAPSTDLVYGTDRTFGTPESNTPFSFDEVILGVSSKDGKYNAWLSKPYEGSLTYKGGHVISKGNGVVDEYFEVVNTNGVLSFKAVQISEETNPTANVPSTLKLVYTDMYKHEVVIELDMTVIPR